MVFPKALSVWFIIMIAEVVHGILRRLFLAPWIGDFPARQRAVFTGAVMILAIAASFIRWIGAVSTGPLLGVGLLWVGLTVAFEHIRASHSPLFAAKGRGVK